MQINPLIPDFLLLFGLSLFFGLAFEEFHAVTGERRPGGVRTFPLLALAGGVLYQLEPRHLLLVGLGVIALSAWLYAYYRVAVTERHKDGDPMVELTAPVCNLLAYLLGPAALALPHWMAVTIAVGGVLLLTARERLHDLARRIEMREIVTAGEFLLLTGIVLPLLPDEPVTALTALTPYKAWLALLAVCTISYASYLLERYVAPRGSDVAVAVLGGFYSSTATTVVLSREARDEPERLGTARAGIVLATAIMYLRMLAIVGIFNPAIAFAIAPAALVLAALGAVVAGGLYWSAGAYVGEATKRTRANPLELWAAGLFAFLFVVISVLTSFARTHYGAAGIYVLAAIVGVTDIDPFVLNLAEGGTESSAGGAAAAILIASASNNFLKAGYGAALAGFRASLPSSAALVLLALGALAGAYLIA
jgi:uncharacterized membrane protein (DUF4010 family)